MNTKKRKMSNVLVLKKNQKQQKKEQLSCSLNDLDSLIAVAQANVEYANINNKTLKLILPYLIELQNIIGMTELKQTIFYQIIYYLQDLHKKSDDYLNTVILGAPGCGKTTVAKILGNIYSNLGILRNNTFTMAKRSDFIGEYLGQTTIKTNKLLKSCIGGLLFIDEVYSLGSGSRDKKDSYSKEAIDALNMFLSEHKSEFCCIIAGYEDDVNDCFFSVNKGLERRFPWIHKIEKYDADELADICFKQIKDIGWQTIVAKKELIKIIKDNMDLFKNTGGDIENLISRTKMSHAKRIFGLDAHHKFIITSTDINNAIKLLKVNKKEEEVVDALPMYC